MPATRHEVGMRLQTSQVAPVQGMQPVATPGWVQAEMLAVPDLGAEHVGIPQVCKAMCTCSSFLLQRPDMTVLYDEAAICCRCSSAVCSPHFSVWMMRTLSCRCQPVLQQVIASVTHFTVDWPCESVHQNCQESVRARWAYPAPWENKTTSGRESYLSKMYSR